jgi:hypothetical protein
MFVLIYVPERILAGKGAGILASNVCEDARLF